MLTIPHTRMDTAPRVRRKVRVMVVDDSGPVRALVSGWLDAEDDVEVVARACSGRDALQRAASASPDVVVLDIEMPEMDGLAALPQLLARSQDLVVIMMSALTQRQAAVSLQALAMGAADYVAKPLSCDPHSAPEFRRELIAKVRQLGWRRILRAELRVAGETSEAPAMAPPQEKFRTAPTSTPQAIVIGASTGGPQALARLLKQLSPAARQVPILVVQHMPALFAKIMADHLARQCGCVVRIARSGERVMPGVVYLAPGGRHLEVASSDRGVTIELTDSEPLNHCRPAVDRLFLSAAAAWGSGVTALVLTGMGQDGADGALAIADAGGCVLAQDEASSIVWGMPGAAVENGACTATLGLDEMAAQINRSLKGEPR
jgi:two-component system chemotaxis response regulator CheB